MLPVLLVLNLRLQRRLLHRPMAFYRGLRPFQSLLQRLLLDSIRASMHRLQARIIRPSLGQLHERNQVLPLFLCALRCRLRGRLLQLCEGDSTCLW